MRRRATQFILKTYLSNAYNPQENYLGSGGLPFPFPGALSNFTFHVSSWLKMATHCIAFGWP